MSSSFPSTAPRFTEEDERREQDLLSPKERADVYEDLRGQHFVDSDTVSPQLENAFALMEEQLLMIPVEEKDAYLQALIRCPEVVATESDKHLFLCYENFDIELAAKRLVKYWETRRTIFQDKAFLPLRLENGALSPEDVDIIETGCMRQLPDDEFGRSVIFHDRSCLNRLNNINYLSITKVIWYVLQAALERDSCRENGFVILMTCKQSSVSLYSRKQMRLTWSAMNDIPIRLRAFHVCHVPPVIDTQVIPIFKKIVSRFVRTRFIIHRSQDLDLTLDLQSYGLRRINLPTEVDGEFNVDFEPWLEERRRLEDYQRRLDELHLRVGFVDTWENRFSELHIILHQIRQNTVIEGSDDHLAGAEAWVEEGLDELEAEVDDWEAILAADMEAEAEQVREAIEEQQLHLDGTQR